MDARQWCVETLLPVKLPVNLDGKSSRDLGLLRTRRTAEFETLQGDGFEWHAACRQKR